LIKFVRGRSQITSRKKTIPSTLSQIFQRKKKFVFGLSQIILSLSPLKRDVICERPLISFNKYLNHHEWESNPLFLKNLKSKAWHFQHVTFECTSYESGVFKDNFMRKFEMQEQKLKQQFWLLSVIYWHSCNGKWRHQFSKSICFNIDNR